MIRVLFRASGLGLLMALAICLPARAVVFTTNTIIYPFVTNYDGADIVVSNCILTVDGQHGFSSVLVGSGGMLTHLRTPSGMLAVPRTFYDEPQVLNDTNAVPLLNAGGLITSTVTDVGKTVTYLYGPDYTITPSNSVQFLQRTTNSTIPDGATVLVTYTLQVSVRVGMNLTVTGNVEVVADGIIDTRGYGYGGNMGTGAGGESITPPVSGGGGSYGGYGGMSSSNGLGGAAYGWFDQPVDLGSGGGFGSLGAGAPGGAGGGAIKIVAGGSLIINGVITANGEDAFNTRSGGGAGGSIWLTAQTISGAGTLTANGGAGEPIHGGGGGGGRIALEMDTNDFTGPITAYGGLGARNGGAGTIHTKFPGQNGKLLADNGGLAGTNTPLQTLSVVDVTVRGRAILGAISSLTLGKLLVESNGTVAAQAAPSTGVTITSGDTTIESGGRIGVDGLNGLTTATSANVSGVIYGGGGGHGGYGGMGANANARGASPFGSTLQPINLGTAGAGGVASSMPFGGLGGGTLRMIVNGNLVLNGTISAEGKPGNGSYAGGGAGGSIWLTLLGTWSGSGTVSANGGAGVLPNGGGGGGGRISITFNTNLYAGAITAYGGIGTIAGGAGTIYLKTNGQTGAAIILDNGGIAGTNTTFDTPAGLDLTITGKASPTLPPSLSVTSLRISSNSTVTTLAGQSIGFTVSGNAIIDAGSAITMDGRGFSQGLGTGSGSTSSSPKGGGGHGGYGGGNPGFGGSGGAYDLITFPNAAGSSGGNGSGTSAAPFGGAGGGVVTLNISTLTVNGRISANGRDGDASSGGGSGGAVNINCGLLLGSGIISVDGGAGNGFAGGGGGGRMAIVYTTSNGFTGTLSASGGNGVIGGGAGTIYTKRLTSIAGTLLVDNGGLGGTNTPLSSTFAVPTQPFNLTISGGAAATLLTPLPLLSNLTVGANSTLTVPSSAPDLTIRAIEDITIAAGGAITADGKGFARGTGPGAGASISTKGSGGGYGGLGGASSSGAPGGTNYGSATEPVDRGSGGGAGVNVMVGGSDGGGAIRLTVGDTLTINGGLSANGNPGFQDDSGGGSGGSIWVIANAVSGGGLITANGGSGDLFGGGGGGGGRILINTRNNSFTGLAFVSGGNGATAGGVGSLLWSTNLAVIQGTVTDTNGQPVAGVMLQASLGNASATTGVDGKYEVSLVPYSAFIVTPSMGGFLFAPASRTYSVPFASANSQDYLMLSTFTPTITGSLQDTNMVVTWPGIPGVSYQLYYSTNLADWLPYGGPFDGTNGVMEIVVPVDSDPMKYFRVRANN